MHYIPENQDLKNMSIWGHLKKRQRKISQQPHFSHVISECKASSKRDDSDTWILIPKVSFYLRYSVAQDKIMHVNYLFFSLKTSYELIYKCYC